VGDVASDAAGNPAVVVAAGARAFHDPISLTPDESFVDYCFSQTAVADDGTLLPRA
jgi:hypothetical protein